MSNKDPFEREFESFLNEEDSHLAALYRKLPRSEPDAKLDAAVLAMARRASTAAPRLRVHRPRWIPALSAAAVVALAAGIAFRIGPQVWQERSVPAAKKTAAGSAVAPAPAAAKIEEKAQPADTGALKDNAVSTPSPIAEPPPRPAPMQPAAPSAAAREKSVAPGPLRKMEAAKPADAPVPQAFPRAAAEQKAAESGIVAGARDAARAGINNELREKELDRRRDDAMQAMPTAAPSAREEPAPPPAESKPFAAQAAGSAAAESTRAAPAPPMQAGRLAPLHSNDPNARLYPEHWLANIRVMLGENKRDEALRSLAEFRRMYPAYNLPADLRDLK